MVSHRKPHLTQSLSSRGPSSYCHHHCQRQLCGTTTGSIQNSGQEKSFAETRRWETSIPTHADNWGPPRQTHSSGKYKKVKNIVKLCAAHPAAVRQNKKTVQRWVLIAGHYKAIREAILSNVKVIDQTFGLTLLEINMWTLTTWFNSCTKHQERQLVPKQAAYKTVGRRSHSQKHDDERCPYLHMRTIEDLRDTLTVLRQLVLCSDSMPKIL